MTRAQVLAWAREEFGPTVIVRNNGPKAPAYRQYQIRIPYLLQWYRRQTSYVAGQGATWDDAVAEARYYSLSTSPKARRV